MAKYSMYEFDQETWVVTVEYPHETLEFCVCSEFYQQCTPPKQRATMIVEALNKMEEKQRGVS